MGEACVSVNTKWGLDARGSTGLSLSFEHFARLQIDN